MTTTITVEWLRKRLACESHLTIFEREWPQGAAVTLNNLLRAQEIGLSLDWFAFHVLPHRFIIEYFQPDESHLWFTKLKQEQEQKKASILWGLLQKTRVQV